MTTTSDAKFKALIAAVIESEREYQNKVHVEMDSAKIDEYKGAIIALRNVLVNASEIRYRKDK